MVNVSTLKYGWNFNGGSTLKHILCVNVETSTLIKRWITVPTSTLKYDWNFNVTATFKYGQCFNVEIWLKLQRMFNVET